MVWEENKYFLLSHSWVPCVRAKTKSQMRWRFAPSLKSMHICRISTTKPCWRFYNPIARKFLESSQAVSDEKYMPGNPPTNLLFFKGVPHEGGVQNDLTSSGGLEDVFGAPFEHSAVHNTAAAPMS